MLGGALVAPAGNNGGLCYTSNCDNQKETNLRDFLIVNVIRLLKQFMLYRLRKN